MWELIFVDLPKVSLSRIRKNVALDILKVSHVYNEIHKIDFIKHDILQSTPTFSVKYNALSNAWRNTLISLTNGTRGERQTPDHCEPCHLPFEGLS